MDEEKTIFLPVIMGPFQFETPPKSTYAVFEHTNGEVSYHINFSHQTKTYTITVDVFPVDRNLEELMRTKYEANDTIIHSPLNIAPHQEPETNRSHCRFLMIDGLKSQVLIDLFGISFPASIVLVTFANDPKQPDSAEEVVNHIVASLQLAESSL